MNEKYNIPRVAIAFNAIVSMIMVTLFRDWGTLAAVISTATLVAYLTGQQQLFHYVKWHLR